MNAIEDLKQKIANANRVYREGKPIISDQEFDDLLESYQKQVSAEEYDKFRDSLHEVEGKIKHPFVMGSLNKLKIEEPAAISKFLHDKITTKLNVSAKVDGISCRLHYENGKPVSASTRGNGSFGEDLTDKIAYVKNVPSEIACKDTLDIRGELVIFKSDFESMSGFANPRNACAGIMNKKHWNKTEIENVSFVAYTVLGPAFEKESQFKLLADNGFYVAWNCNIERQTCLKAGFIDKLFEMASKEHEYDTDGLVVCDSTYKNEVEYRPENCMAIKINQLIATSKIVDVEWNGPSKNGLFVPVALLEPVQLGGSTITRVTLNNLDYIEKMNIKYGSVVSLLKSGDIIPKIVDIISNVGATDIQTIEECPCCGSKLVRDGVNMRCMNKDCKDQVVTQIMHFIKKLGVKHCSFATLDNFKIHSFEDLLAFAPNKKYKMEVKLYDELASKVFTRSKEELLAATDFCGLSETLINKIVNHYGYDNIQAGQYSKGLPSGVGDILLERFKTDIDKNLKIVSMILSDMRYSYAAAVTKQAEATAKNGMSVCFTGKLNTMSRTEASKKALDAGYEVLGGVKKGLTYLVTNDANSGSSKNKKAKELNVKVISEEEFLKIVANSDSILEL